MTTKVKAFIGIAIAFVILIILFSSKGGYRASRETASCDQTCESKIVDNKAEMQENSTQDEIKR